MTEQLGNTVLLSVALVAAVHFLYRRYHARSMARSQQNDDDDDDDSLATILSPAYLGLDGDEALVQATRATLERDQIVVLPDFLLPGAVKKLAEDGLQAAAGVRHGGLHYSSPYYKEPDPTLPTEHPKNAKSSKAMRYVTNDLIPPESALRKLHESRRFSRFLSACTGVSDIYHCEQALGAHEIGLAHSTPTYAETRECARAATARRRLPAL